MKKTASIEVEGKEIAIKNSFGDIAIIPIDKVSYIKDLIKSGNNNKIDEYVSSLPRYSDYAKNGSLYPYEKEKVTLVKPSGERIETTTDSDVYRTYYSSGLIGNKNEDGSYGLTDEIYASPLMADIEITDKVSQNSIGKYIEEYNSSNSNMDDYVSSKVNADRNEFEKAPKFAKDAVGGFNSKREESSAKAAKEEYLKDKVDFVAKRILDNNPYDGMDNRLNWLSRFNEDEKNIIKSSKYANKLEPSAFQKFENSILGFGTSGINFKSPGTTDEEAEEHRKYKSNILELMEIPTKVVQSAYKKDYTINDAIEGRENDASLVENILTDPMNLTGVGALSKYRALRDLRRIGDVYSIKQEIDEKIKD